MRPFLKITVNADRLHIEGPQGQAMVANLIGIVDENIWATGETPAEILSRSGGEPLPDDIKFQPIFDLHYFDPEMASQAALNLAIKMAGADPHPRQRNVDFSLDFPGFETLPRDDREAFEYWIMFELCPVDFKINGQPAGCSPRQFTLATVTYEFLPLLWPLIPMTIFTLSAILTGTQSIFIIVLLLISAAAVLVTMPLLFNLLWALIMTRFVPVSILRYILYHNLDRIEVFKKPYLAALDRTLPIPTDPT